MLLTQWYHERRKDKVLFVSVIADKLFKINNGTYIQPFAKEFTYKKINYLLGKATLMNKYGKLIHLFNLEKGEPIGYDLYKTTGMTAKEINAYLNGGFIASLRRFLSKSLTDWLLIAFAFLGGAGLMAVVGGVV